MNAPLARWQPPTSRRLAVALAELPAGSAVDLGALASRLGLPRHLVSRELEHSPLVVRVPGPAWRVEFVRVQEPQP